MNAEFAGREGGALVTGGSGGIGAEVCRLLAERGSDVGLSYRSHREAAVATVATVEAQGRAGAAWACDLTDPDAARRLVDAAVERFGQVHTFVHAAGPFVPQEFMSAVEPERYRRQLDEEAGGFFNVLQPLVPHLRESGGAVVAVTTVAIRRFPVRDGLSPATKGAVEALVRVIAHEEGRFGIRANCVGPGILGEGMAGRLIESGEFSPEAMATTTARIPLRRLGKAVEVAEAACFLASERASYITGQTIDVDGGYST